MTCSTQNCGRRGEAVARLTNVLFVICRKCVHDLRAMDVTVACSPLPRPA